MGVCSLYVIISTMPDQTICILLIFTQDSRSDSDMTFAYSAVHGIAYGWRLRAWKKMHSRVTLWFWHWRVVAAPFLCWLANSWGIPPTDTLHPFKVPYVEFAWGSVESVSWCLVCIVQWIFNGNGPEYDSGFRMGNMQIVTWNMH